MEGVQEEGGDEHGIGDGYSPEEPDEAETTESAGEPETPESAIDQGALEEKIGAIARELFSIDGEGTET